MLSLKQLFANQANAKKSTGPRTPQGKAHASQNALKHGFFARAVLLPQEDHAFFDDFARALRHDWMPLGANEELLVAQITAGAWKLQRQDRLEAGVYSGALTDAADAWRREQARNLPNGAPLPDVPEDVCWNRAFGQNPDNLNTLDKLSRYQSRVSREFSRASRELQQLQSARPKLAYNDWRKLQNEPISYDAAATPYLSFPLPPDQEPVEQNEPIEQKTGTGSGVPVVHGTSVPVPAFCDGDDTSNLPNEPISDDNTPATPLPSREGPGVGPVEQPAIGQNEPISPPPPTLHVLTAEEVATIKAELAVLQNEPIEQKTGTGSGVPVVHGTPVPVPAFCDATQQLQNKSVPTDHRPPTTDRKLAPLNHASAIPLDHIPWDKQEEIRSTFVASGDLNPDWYPPLWYDPRNGYTLMFPEVHGYYIKEHPELFAPPLGTWRPR